VIIAARVPWELSYTSSMRTQVILELDETTARQLEEVAPARARRRSVFLRQALRQALDAEAERRMREAYAKQPDRSDEAYVDAAVWEPRGQRRGSR
jgi:hypothetical protein